MGRTQRALTSLVAAIPAGFLAYLLVDVFLKRADTLPTVTKVLVGVTLLCAALVALMPFGLLIFGGARKNADDAGKPTASRKGAKADDDEEVEAVEDVEEAGDDDDDSVSAFDDESDADADADVDIMADSDDDLTSGPPSSMDEIESVDFEDEEVEEAPAPKKRKK